MAVLNVLPIMLARMAQIAISDKTIGPVRYDMVTIIVFAVEPAAFEKRMPNMSIQALDLYFIFLVVGM